MSLEKEFDNTFKERINQMDFEFKEAYWDEMEALLDNKKKKRGALFWWISSLSVASILLASTLFFIPNKAENKTQNAATKSEKSVEKNQSEQVTRESLDTSESMEHAPLDNENPGAHAEFSEVENTTLQESTNRKQQNGNQKSYHKQKNTESNQNTKNQESSSSLAHQSSESAPNALTSIAETKTNASNQETTFTENQNLTHEKLERLPSLAVDLAAENKQHSTAQPGEKPQVASRSWDSHVGILAGANFGQSVKTNEGTVGGLGSHWGLRFYFAHKKGLQLNTGLAFGVNSISGLKYEEHRKVFGFTQYDLVNTIHYQSMLTAHVPLYVGYEGAKFSVAGGLRLNYIMNTKGRVYTWDNAVYDQNIWGYAHGIKYFNMACGFESTYRLARRWDAGASFDLDLSSRSEENNNLISPEARLWQAGIFIKYRLN